MPLDAMKAGEPCDHVLEVYDDDRDLVQNVATFLHAGLAQGESAMVIGTPAHRAAIEAGLAANGLDVTSLTDEGRYYPLDAAETLAGFMKGGRPDPDSFMEVVGTLVKAAGSVGPVRAFGEMVAILWESGNVMGALELEGLWNGLRTTQEFALYCAYPLRSLAASGDLLMASQVCSQHSDLVAPRSYSEPASGDLTDISAKQSLLFVPSPSAISAVRRFVARTLRSWGSEDGVADAVVVASELATNAVRHASSAFRISLERGEDAVRIGVEDVSSVLPPEKPDREETSLGLHVVETLATRWGTDVQPMGKVVWAELGLAT